MLININSKVVEMYLTSKRIQYNSIVFTNLTNTNKNVIIVELKTYMIITT